MLITRRTRASAALLFAMALFASHSAAQETFEIVARFPTSVTRPEGPLLLAPDGSIYATAPTGGAFGRGSVFVLRPDGMGGYSQEDLYSFSGPDGIAPVYGVTFGTDGRLYGTTSRGGPADAGTFFRIDGAGHLTQLATVAAGGGSPPGPLSLGSDGNLYGSSSGGGANGAGTIFRLDGSTGTLTTLHDFGPGEGSAPYSCVVQGSDGRYYGTTTKGGSSDLGTVYAIDASGTFETIHEFSGTDGSDPGASFLAASDGALYGTTTQGGAAGYGTIYRITVAGDLTTLYHFAFSPAYDPPKARRLVEAIDGNFYGTTAPDLISSAPSTFYRIDSLGNYTGIALFPPIGPMTPGVSGDGSIYVAGYGVYRLDLSGNSTALSAGPPPPQVLDPGGRLIETPAGTLYALASSDRSVLLRLDLSGTPAVAHDFPLYNSVNADLLHLDDGSFYGTTYSGPGEYGSVFRLDASFVETDLHDFSGDDGTLPYVGLTAGPSGEIWGTTRDGGANHFGTIFKIDALGAFTSLHSFDAGEASWDPLVYATDGNFYGLLKDDAYFVSSASAFRADSQGSVTPLHDFTPGGRFPTSLFQGTDGDFYGIMATPPFDPSPGDTIFKMDSAGAVTPLYDFPSGSGRRLFRVGDGTIYGASTPSIRPTPVTFSAWTRRPRCRSSTFSRAARTASRIPGRISSSLPTAICTERRAATSVARSTGSASTPRRRRSTRSSRRRVEPREEPGP